MAGDWTPLRDNIHDDPDVFAIAAALKVRDTDLVVGKLTRFWAWCSQHSADGTLPGVTMAAIDRIARRPGLAAAMLSIGWLTGKEGSLSVPHYDRWMSQNAKARLGEAKRKQIQRSGPDKSGEMSGQLSGQKRDHRTGQDRTEETPTHSSSRNVVAGNPSSASVGADLTGDQKAVLDYLTLAEVGRMKATQLALAGLTLADARRINDARKQAGKPPDGRFVAQLAAAAAAEKVRMERRKALATNGGPHG